MRHIRTNPINGTRNENPGPWTTVTPRCARGSRGVQHAIEQAPAVREPAAGPLPADPVVQQATEDLTPEQRDKISRRYEKIMKPVRRPHAPLVSSRGEGPLQPKGKGVDPENWGNADIPDAELDPNVQRAVFASIDVENLSCDMPPHMAKKKSNKRKKSGRQTRFCLGSASTSSDKASRCWQGQDA